MFDLDQVRLIAVGAMNEDRRRLGVRILIRPKSLVQESLDTGAVLVETEGLSALVAHDILRCAATHPTQLPRLALADEPHVVPGGSTQSFARRVDLRLK